MQSHSCTSSRNQEIYHLINITTMTNYEGALEMLIESIIQTLKDRDDNVADWVQEQFNDLKEIKELQ
jgi:hypothetical protein